MNSNAILAEKLSVVNTDIETGTGEILSDPKENGEERPWKKYKKLAEILYRIFLLALKLDPTCIADTALFRLAKCSGWLLFRRYANKLKLQSADFCRHRLCPICNWRKAMKLFGQMKEITGKLQTDFPAARYIFLTLTVQNCAGDELEETLNRMNDGFKLLVNAGKTNASAKPVKASLLGYAKAMEIKYDPEKYITEKMFRDRKKYYQARGLAIGDENPNCDKYHPHFHVLLMVKSEFFRSGYIRQERWAEIWQDCMKLDYRPQVDVRTIKPNDTRKTDDLTSAISETMKYPVKPDSLKLAEFDAMDAEQKERIVQATITISRVLRSRRLISFGGAILKARKELKQDDVEEGDLIGKDGDPVPETEFELVLYRWRNGAYIC